MTYNWKFRERDWFKIDLTQWLHYVTKCPSFCSAIHGVIAKAGFPFWLQDDLLTFPGLHSYVSICRQREKLFLEVLSEEPDSFNFIIFSLEAQANFFSHLIGINWVMCLYQKQLP